jgi:lipopolysaccharide/colanic/teichoic acid biosynthesis glycosyltransferase
MYNNAQLYATTPTKSEDERITHAGKFLRNTGLDELPQLLNVFWGDMSLVGPRPEMEFIVKTYLPFQHVRHLVKPGITGLWQIQGRRESVHILDAVYCDYYYAEHQTMALDFYIIFNTVPMLLGNKGAY